MHAMTAAHRTLPLGSIVRVTNLNTGHRALVRITDRGPFIPGRILDLSLAAAKKLDVYLPGTAEVKLEVMETPAPLNIGGKWAVQIGGFPREKAADKLANHLKRRYETAKVQSFPSPTGDWWSGCECSTMTASAPKNWLPKPIRLTARFLWSG